MTEFWLFMLSIAIWTHREILTATNASFFIANHTPMSHRRRFNVILSVVMGLDMSLNPLLVWLYIEAYTIGWYGRSWQESTFRLRR